MKQKNLLLTALACFFCAFSIAQIKSETDQSSVKYRRSSIYMLILDDAGLIHGDVIKDAFMKASVPDKFNDHNLTIRSFDPKKYPITDAERKKPGDSKAKSAFKTLGKSFVSDATGGLVDTTATRDIPIQIEKFFTDKNIPQGLVAKWFNRDAQGTFNMNLIGERGSYDATEMQANIAKSSARGTALLADAGEELIGNTFVVVTRLKYISKEEIAKAAKSAVSLAGSFGGSYGQLAAATANTATDVLAKGYVVQSTSYLYLLNWNDSIAAVFYQNYWMDKSNINPAKKKAFDTTKLFTMKFIGSEKAWADVQSTVFTKKSEEELIRNATINSIDAVIANLQKEYDVFKTKTPLYSANPLTAKIGLKEGLEKGDKYEVLEQVLDEQTNRTKYVRKGVITVEKDKIWDNRYMAADIPPADTTAAALAKPAIDRTFFKGGSKFYAGMLIRQIK